MRAGRPRDPALEAAIVAATLELLEERGYGDLTLASIAHRAGTTTAAIYRRWRSKSELVATAVFRTDADDVVAETDDLGADIETMVRWAVEKVYRPVAVVAIGGLLSEPRDVRRAVAADAATASRLVAERLERAKALGQLRADVDPRVLAALVDGPVLHAALSGGTDEIDEAWITGLVRIVLDGARPDSAPSPRSPGVATQGRRTPRREAAPK